MSPSEITRIVATPGPAAGCCTAAGAGVGSSWLTTGVCWAAAPVVCANDVVAEGGIDVAVGDGAWVAVGIAVGLGNTSRSSGIGVTVGTAGGTVLATGSGLNEMLLSPAIKRRTGIELRPQGVDADVVAAGEMVGKYKRVLKSV